MATCHAYQCNVHCYDKQHETPLHFAVTNRHPKVVQALMDVGTGKALEQPETFQKFADRIMTLVPVVSETKH